MASSPPPARSSAAASAAAPASPPAHPDFPAEIARRRDGGASPSASAHRMGRRVERPDGCSTPRGAYGGARAARGAAHPDSQKDCVLFDAPAAPAAVRAGGRRLTSVFFAASPLVLRPHPGHRRNAPPVARTRCARPRASAAARLARRRAATPPPRHSCFLVFFAVAHGISPRVPRKRRQCWQKRRDLREHAQLELRRRHAVVTCRRPARRPRRRAGGARWAWRAVHAPRRAVRPPRRHRRQAERRQHGDSSKRRVQDAVHGERAQRIETLRTAACFSIRRGRDVAGDGGMISPWTRARRRVRRRLAIDVERACGGPWGGSGRAGGGGRGGGARLVRLRRIGRRSMPRPRPRGGRRGRGGGRPAASARRAAWRRRSSSTSDAHRATAADLAARPRGVSGGIADDPTETRTAHRGAERRARRVCELNGSERSLTARECLTKPRIGFGARQRSRRDHSRVLMRVRRRPSFSLSVVAMIDRLLEHQNVVCIRPAPSAASPSPVPSMRAPSAAAEEAVEALRAARAASGARAPFAPDAPADAGAPDAATACRTNRGGLTNTERHEMDQLREKYGAHQRARDARSRRRARRGGGGHPRRAGRGGRRVRARPVATAEDRAARCRRSVVACFACQGQRTIKEEYNHRVMERMCDRCAARASSSTARPCPRAGSTPLLPPAVVEPVAVRAGAAGRSLAGRDARRVRQREAGTARSRRR